MRIAIPKETKVHEYRVGMTPAGVKELVSHGHEVRVQSQCGAAIGLQDADYQQAGAEVETDVESLWGWGELIVKVKEPQAEEYARLKPEQCLFTYLHLAADGQQAQGLIDSGCTAIAYETVTDAAGRLPLLAPMSEVAGRMSIQAGAHCLELEQGGKGTLLAGVPGVPPGQVVVLGGGVVGTNAARIALGLGADVKILDTNLNRLRQLDDQYGPRLKTLFASQHNIEQSVAQADLVIGAVLIPGAEAPKLVSVAMLESMATGAVVVDVAVDQGGCIASTRPTTHQIPTFIEHGVVHYCVANMPGAVARTATFALTNATLPYVVKLANQGIAKALQGDQHLLNGLNIRQGKVTYRAVAEALGCAYAEPLTLLN